MDSPISRVLAHYGAGKVPAGRGWRKMNCPFHGDRHASGSVNHDLNAFNCFACDVTGNIYNIIMIQEGVSYHEAKSRAEEIAGTSDISLPKSNTLGRRLSNQQGSISSRRKQIQAGSGKPTSRRSRTI